MLSVANSEGDTDRNAGGRTSQRSTVATTDETKTTSMGHEGTRVFSAVLSMGGGQVRETYGASESMMRVEAPGRKKHQPNCPRRSKFRSGPRRS